MYRGSFPDTAEPTPVEPRVPLLRRHFLVVAAAFFAGGAAGGVAARWMSAGPGEPDSDPEPEPVPTPPAPAAARGSLGWALAMADAPADELLRAAGDLERVSAQHRTADRLVPTFERLLDVALRSDDPHADAAGACAVRSLVRLGHAADVVAREDEVAGRPDLTETAAALERARARAGGR